MFECLVIHAVTFKYGVFSFISAFLGKVIPCPWFAPCRTRAEDLPCFWVWPRRYGVRGLLFVHALAISAQVSGVSSECFETTSALEGWWRLPAALFTPPGCLADEGAGARFMVFCTSGGLTADALATSCAGT